MVMLGVVVDHKKTPPVIKRDKKNRLKSTQKDPNNRSGLGPKYS